MESREKLDGSKGRSMNRRTFLRTLMMGSISVSAAAAYIGYQNYRLQAQIHAILEARKIPRSSPKVLAQDAETMKMLQEGFSLIAGNASIEDAKVIAIGERHLSFANEYSLSAQEQREAIAGTGKVAALLERIVQNGDHVLIEGIDAEVPDFKPFGIMLMEYPWLIRIHDKDISMGGWDDRETHSQFRKNMTALEMSKNAQLRNERGMIPALLQAVNQRTGRVFVIGGVGHFMDDPRIDHALEQAGIPYSIFGEKGAVRSMDIQADEVR